MRAARSSSSSLQRSPGGLEMPPPPPIPPRTESGSPTRAAQSEPQEAQATGNVEAGQAAASQGVLQAAQEALGALLPWGRSSTDPEGTHSVLRLRAVAPTLSPVAQTSSTSATASLPSALASPTANPPSAAEVLNDGSLLHLLPRQCMRYTQRLDGTWKQWGPMPLPEGDGAGIASNEQASAEAVGDLKMKLHEAETRAAQLQAALGQAARQGKAQCAQFERRLGEMEAEAIRNAALGGDEQARMQIERLQARVNHLDIEAADLRTEATVARAASEKSRTAMAAAKRAAEASRKKVETLEAAASKDLSRDEAARARLHSRAEDVSTAHRAARRAAAAATEECFKLKDRVHELEASLDKVRGEAAAYKHQLKKSESSLEILQPVLDVETSGREQAQASLECAEQQLASLQTREAEWGHEKSRREQAQASLECAEQQLASLQAREAEWDQGRQRQMITKLQAQLDAQEMVLQGRGTQLNATEHALRTAEAEQTRLTGVAREERTAAKIAAEAQAAAEAYLSVTELNTSTAQTAAQERLEKQEMLAAKLQDELAQANTDRKSALETLAAQVASTEILKERMTQLDNELAVAQTSVTQSASQQLEITRLKEHLACEAAAAEQERERLKQRAADPLLWSADRLLYQLDNMDKVLKTQAAGDERQVESTDAVAESSAPGVPGFLAADRGEQCSGASQWKDMTGVWHAVGMSNSGGRKEAWLHLRVDRDGRLTGHEARETEACVLEARLIPNDSSRMADGVWEGAQTGFFEAVQVEKVAEDDRPSERSVEQDDSYPVDAESLLLADGTVQQPSLLSIEREVTLLKEALASAAEDTNAQLEHQSRKMRIAFDAEQNRLTDAHAKEILELSEQRQMAQQAAETRLEFVKAAHARELAKATAQLEVARDHIYQLRQAQLLRGHNLSGIWRVSGVCSKTKQQVAIRMLVQHDVNSGSVAGGHVPGDPVEFAFENGRIVGDQMHLTQTFLDGQQVDWQMRCERGFAEDVVEIVERIFSNGPPAEMVDSKTNSTDAKSFSDIDFKAVRARGEWAGAMEGQFTATRQIDQQQQSTKAATEGSQYDTTSPVAPSGWKKPPAKQVQLAFNAPAQKLHRMFARLDVTGEGIIPFAELVRQLSQDVECVQAFKLPLGDDQASVALRHKALLTAFAGLPEAANAQHPVDADGLVRLIMGASRRPLGTKISADVVVSFTEPGTLGLKLKTNKAGAVEILAVNPTTQAAQYASLLQPGLVIQTVNGVSVVGLDYAGTIGTIQAAGRPVELGFKQQEVTKHATKTRTPEQAAELIMIERDLLQRRCDKLYAQLRRRRQQEQLDKREKRYSGDELKLRPGDEVELDDLNLMPATPPPRGENKTTAATTVGGLARIAQTVGDLAKKHSPVNRAGHGERRHGAATDWSPPSTTSHPARTTTRV